MFRFHREIYLDNNATTKVSKKVQKVMSDVLKRNYGNPSSLYKVSHDSLNILNESREIIASSINAEPFEIIFTGSASEANNAVIKSLAEQAYPKKRKILSTPIEHQSVISCLDYLKKKNYEIEYIPVDREGFILLEELEAMIDQHTFLICCMFANNEIGTIQNIKAVSALAKKHKIAVLSDCVQALGKIAVDVKELGVDYASFSAHKIHGPKGVGALYVKRGSELEPFIHGGHQEHGKRAGTESLHNIAGFSEACRLVPEMIKQAEKIKTVKNYFVQELIKLKKDAIINSPELNCLSNTISIVFPGINNAVLMAVLDFYGIAVSAGSACNTQSNEASHVLKAIGITDQHARETIRFSLPVDSSEKISIKKIKYVLEVINNYLHKKTPAIGMISPKQLNEKLLFDENNFIVDVRYWYDRKALKGLPNSYEASIFIKKYLNKIPKDKNIIVVCQVGFDSPMTAYSLKAKGYNNVGFLMFGLIGWRLQNKHLYKKYAGQNITKL
jgi:cysteine desulfurase